MKKLIAIPIIAILLVSNILAFDLTGVVFSFTKEGVLKYVSGADVNSAKVLSAIYSPSGTIKNEVLTLFPDETADKILFASNPQSVLKEEFFNKLPEKDKTIFNNINRLGPYVKNNNVDPSKVTAEVKATQLGDTKEKTIVLKDEKGQEILKLPEGFTIQENKKDKGLTITATENKADSVIEFKKDKTSISDIQKGSEVTFSTENNKKFIDFKKGSGTIFFKEGVEGKIKTKTESMDYMKDAKIKVEDDLIISADFTPTQTQDYSLYDKEGILEYAIHAPKDNQIKFSLEQSSIPEQGYSGFFSSSGTQDSAFFLNYQKVIGQNVNVLWDENEEFKLVRLGEKGGSLQDINSELKLSSTQPFVTELNLENEKPIEERYAIEGTTAVSITGKGENSILKSTGLLEVRNLKEDSPIGFSLGKDNAAFTLNRGNDYAEVSGGSIIIDDPEHKLEIKEGNLQPVSNEGLIKAGTNLDLKYASSNKEILTKMNDKGQVIELNQNKVPKVTISPFGANLGGTIQNIIDDTTSNIKKDKIKKLSMMDERGFKTIVLIA